MTKISDGKRRFSNELQERFIDMLRSHGVLRPAGFEEAFRAVPRHLFIEQYVENGPKRWRKVTVDPLDPTKTQLMKIYSNNALTTDRPPKTSSTSQPALVAGMLAHLDLEPGIRVLEIGAGTGWNAALTGHLIGPKGHVTSIELEADLSKRARRGLRRAGVKNVRVITGDGADGDPSGAPFDRIVTTVGVPDIFPAWVEQLRVGGVLLVTIQATVHGHCLLSRLEKQADHLKGEALGPTQFITLRGKQGRVPDAQTQKKRLEQAKSGRRRRNRLAPWVCLHPGFRGWRLGDLLFFADLEGLSVEQVGDRYVVSSPEFDGACVADGETVAVYGDEAVYEAFESANRRWLEAGAPSIGDYRLEVWPKGVSRSRPKNGWLVQREHSQLLFRLKPPKQRIGRR